MKSERFAIGLICFGLLMLGASFLWPLLLPEEVIWNEEQAREKSTAAAELHNMTHVAAHTEVDEDMSAEEKEAILKELDVAQVRFNDSKSALDRARRVRDTTALVMRWCGVFLAIVGVARYKIIQSDDRNRKKQRV